MENDRKVIRRGLWKRETVSFRNFSDPEAFRKFADEAGWDQSHEQSFRAHIEYHIAVATATLAKAGFTTRDGLYKEDKTGKFTWLGDFGADLKMKPNTSYHAWPYFLEVEPLSVECFAVSLIHNAKGYLQRVESGADKWEVATMSIHYADALLKFAIESSGIGPSAVRGISIANGAKKSHRMRSEVSNFARNTIGACVTQLGESAATKNALTVARTILRDVNLAVTKHSGGRAMKVETIQRHIQKLRRK